MGLGTERLPPASRRTWICAAVIFGCILLLTAAAAWLAVKQPCNPQRQAPPLLFQSSAI